MRPDRCRVTIIEWDEASNTGIISIKRKMKWNAVVSVLLYTQ